MLLGTTHYTALRDSVPGLETLFDGWKIYVLVRRIASA
jgi:hypothetical protein